MTNAGRSFMFALLLGGGCRLPPPPDVPDDDVEADCEIDDDCDDEVGW